MFRSARRPPGGRSELINDRRDRAHQRIIALWHVVLFVLALLGNAAEANQFWLPSSPESQIAEHGFAAGQKTGQVRFSVLLLTCSFVVTGVVQQENQTCPFSSSGQVERAVAIPFLVVLRPGLAFRGDVNRAAVTDHRTLALTNAASDAEAGVNLWHLELHLQQNGRAR